MRDAGARHIETDLEHRLLEKLAILALGDRLRLRADHLHVVPLEHAVAIQFHRALSAVWPPSVGRSASGFSRSMIFSTTSGVIGSM